MKSLYKIANLGNSFHISMNMILNCLSESKCRYVLQTKKFMHMNFNYSEPNFWLYVN